MCTTVAPANFVEAVYCESYLLCVATACAAIPVECSAFFNDAEHTMIGSTGKVFAFVLCSVINEVRWLLHID